MAPLTVVSTVPGTHGRRRSSPWWERSAPFMRFLKTHGVKPLHPTDPFNWSTDLDGWFWSDKHYDWRAGGDALAWYLRTAPPHARNVLTHSHGLQVALYAAAKGCRIHRLISVTGPVRKDMLPVAEKARLNIGQWLHIHTDRSDLIQLLGSLFDGHLGIHREHPLADRNDAVAGVGHSGLFTEPPYFKHWLERGWLEFLRP